MAVANPDATPVIANEPTMASPRPIRVSRSNSNRLSRAGACGRCPHCSDSASRRFDIQPIPVYSAPSRPMTPIELREVIALSMMLLISLSRPGGTFLVTPALSCSSRSGCRNST
jgi:hypothetical protein